MTDREELSYTIKDTIELNLSYMPFIQNGGLFIPTDKTYSLKNQLIVNLLLPGKKNPLKIEGQVVWLTPKNALHHVLPGVGIQFTGSEAVSNREEIEKNLDNSMDVGGYVYGITESKKK